MIAVAISSGAAGLVIAIVVAVAVVVWTLADFTTNHDAANEDAARRRVLRELERHKDEP